MKLFVGDLDHAFARDAGESAGTQRRRVQRAVFGPEQVCCSCGNNLTAFIQHDSFVKVAALGFFPREHVIEVVQTLDSG